MDSVEGRHDDDVRERCIELISRLRVSHANVSDSLVLTVQRSHTKTHTLVLMKINPPPAQLGRILRNDSRDNRVVDYVNMQLSRY